MKTLTVVFLCFLMTNFFGATEINNKLFLIFMVPFVFIEFPKKSIFKKYFIVVFIGLFLSMISCSFFREQPFLFTLSVSTPYFFILFYYVLKKINLSISKMEKTFFVLVVIFCVCYIIQYFVYPVRIFLGANREYFERRAYLENVRIWLTGQGIASLGYFFGLNKYLLNNKKVVYLLLAIVCFAVTTLMGFRTILIAFYILTLMMIIRVKGFSWKLFIYWILILGIFIAIFNIPVFSDKINYMLERQESQVFTNPGYIRIRQFQYFTQQHFQNVWEYIFGSGMPFESLKTGESSAYGLYMSGLRTMGITWVDFGLLSLSWMIGIPAVLAMIGYSIKAFRIKVPSDYYYLGIWFVYLVVSSFTTKEFYREGNFIIQAFALYLVEKVHKECL